MTGYLMKFVPKMDELCLKYALKMHVFPLK